MVTKVTSGDFVPDLTAWPRWFFLDDAFITIRPSVRSFINAQTAVRPMFSNNNRSPTTTVVCNRIVSVRQQARTRFRRTARVDFSPYAVTHEPRRVRFIRLSMSGRALDDTTDDDGKLSATTDETKSFKSGFAAAEAIAGRGGEGELTHAYA